MERITCLYTRKDNVRIFLRHYYNAGPKWVRRLLGPILLVFGLSFYFQYDPREHNFMFTIAALVMGVGIWYSLKPFFTLLFKRKQFAAEELTLALESAKKISITDSSGTAKIDIDRINSLVQIGKDWILTFDSKASLYLLAHGIKEGNLEKLVKVLQAAMEKQKAGQKGEETKNQN